MSPLAGLVAAVLGGVGGLALVPVVAALPEPPPEPEPEEDAEPTAAEQARREEPPKEPYADLAAHGWYRVSSVAVAAIAAGSLGLALGWSWLLVLLVPLAVVGTALALVDLRTRLLPSRLVLPALALALLYGLVAWPLSGSAEALVRGLVGMTVAWTLFFVAWFVHPRGMGYGDVRLSALLGFALAYVGWAELVVGLYTPFLLFGVPGLLLALVRWDRRLLRLALPFGPAMLAGALLGLLAGAPIVDALLTTR